MSLCAASAGTFAAMLSFDGSKKWIIREGVTGISRSGIGAPIASGLVKSRGFRKAGSSGSVSPPPAADRR
jgi:hypothetical protein